MKELEMIKRKAVQIFSEEELEKKGRRKKSRGRNKERNS